MLIHLYLIVSSCSCSRHRYGSFAWTCSIFLVSLFLFCFVWVFTFLETKQCFKTFLAFEFQDASFQTIFLLKTTHPYHCPWKPHHEADTSTFSNPTSDFSFKTFKRLRVLQRRAVLKVCSLWAFMQSILYRICTRTY